MTLPLGAFLIVVFAFNLAAFVAQGVDKRRARRGLTRISERTLLCLGLPLASPGIFLGMRFFHHKTGKFSFVSRAGMVFFANLLTAGVIGVLAMQGVLVFDLRLY